MSIDLLDLYHKGSVTVNRHEIPLLLLLLFLLVKIDTVAWLTAFKVWDTVGLRCLYDYGLCLYLIILAQGHKQVQHDPGSGLSEHCGGW